MRTNRITRSERLRRRVFRLEHFENDAWVTTPDRYYPYCTHCGITRMQLDIDGDHRRGCALRGHAKQVIYWRRLLAFELASRDDFQRNLLF
jgi:hypothetical protein